MKWTRYQENGSQIPSGHLTSCVNSDQRQTVYPWFASMCLEFRSLQSALTFVLLDTSIGPTK